MVKLDLFKTLYKRAFHGLRKSVVVLLFLLFLISLSAFTTITEFSLFNEYPHLIFVVAIFLLFTIITFILKKYISRQIIQLRQVKDIARQNEEKYRLLAENTSDVVWLTDLNFNLRYISPSVKKMLGWSVAERMKITLEEKIPPKDIEKLKLTLNEELEKDKVPGAGDAGSRVLELQHYCADGSTIWVEMNISLVKDKSGQPIGINGISRDITEKVKARKYIEKRLAMEKLLSKISRKAVGDFDVDAIIEKLFRKVGSAMDVCRVYLFEYDNQSDTVCNTHEWCTKNVSAQMAHLQQLSCTEISWFCDKLKQGKSIKYKSIDDIPDEKLKNALKLQEIMSILLVPLVLNDQFYGFIGFDECRKAKKWHSEDIKFLQSVAFIITSLLARKQTENELRIKSRSVELSLVAKAISDLEGRITYANQTFLRYWRYQKLEDVLDMTVFDFWESSYESGKVVEIIQESGRWQGELKGIRADGTVFDTLVQASMVTNKEGKPIAMQASFFDITERKIWEHELFKAKEKAEESSRIKSAFLNNLSHEIRTPMNGILGFVNLLKEMHLSSQEKKEYIHLINESGKRLMDTINDLVESSIIEAGETSIKEDEFDLAELMNGIYRLYQPEADKKKLKLTMNFKLEKLLIKTDRIKLERVFYKLLNNALKFTEKGRIEFGAEVKETFLHFYVKDTGVGIAENQVDTLFHPFIQADMGLNRRHEGSGLGLSISKAYVERLGGKIGFKSKKDAGSTFFFTIPYHPVPVASIKNEQEKVQQENFLEGKKVLIAEDDNLSYLLLEASLKSSGAHILHAVTGKDSVQIFLDNPDIYVILMDIKMPEMNGIEATRKIRAINRDVPIIAQTALTFPELKKELMEAGFNDCISKPLDYDLVLEKIKAFKSGLVETM